MGRLQIFTRNPLTGDRQAANRDCNCDCDSDCDCNCDCACPSFGVAQKHDARPATGSKPWRWLLPDQLYITPLADAYWLACNPLASRTQVAVINSDARRLLNFFREPTSFNEINAELAAHGIDVDEARQTVETLAALELLVAEGWRPVPPVEDAGQLTAWLHVTNECNLRCTYCYLHKTPDAMSEQVMRDAIAAVVRSAKAHQFRRVKLKFAGGEATLNFPLVLTAYDFANALTREHDLDLDAVVLSNGISLARSMAHSLKTRGIRLMISLDGLNEYNDIQRVFANGQGSSLSVTRSIDRLLEWGLIPDISITVTMQNLEGLPELLRYVLQRRLPFSINLCRQFPDGSSQVGDETLIAGLKRAYQVIEEHLPERTLLGALADRANLVLPHARTCGVGRNYVVINEKGQIAPCQMVMNQTIGAVNGLDVIAVIRSDQNPIRNVHVDEKEPCRRCPWRYWCTGGCALYTQWSTGRHDVRSPYCHVYQAIFPEVLRLEGLSILRQAQMGAA